MVVGIGLSLLVLSVNVAVAEPVSSSTSGYLSMEIRSKISELVKLHGITGYSLGVLSTGTEEYAQWGNMTDDGRLVDENVCINSDRFH
jgi:hypothetical protein